MNLLCFDISSSGISAVLFSSQLEASRVEKNHWNLETDERDAATLPVAHVIQRFKEAIRNLSVAATDPIQAICIGTFMHNLVLLDAADQPLSPVFTWLDQRGDSGVEYVRSRVGDRFHQLTGCRYHPMYPVFKLASLHLTDPELLKRSNRIVSIKALLINRLTGIWIEDHGMASASGLFNSTRGDWDVELLKTVGLDRAQLPPIADRAEIVGRVAPSAAAEFGLIAGTPVLAGTGDGFFANVGSDCEAPSRIAVTLGTSAVARQTLSKPVLDLTAGTFCYRADRDSFLLGCAGSNGGNVLDWGRQILGTLKNADASEDPPIFIPLLHGERSPDWNPHLTGSWHGLTARHTAADLSRSVLEGVVFNLAHFIEIVQQASAERATDLVLSGNGFLHPVAAPILAAVTGLATWIPRTPGFGSPRCLGICALRALGQSVPALQVDRVSPFEDARILLRYREYFRLRSAVGALYERPGRS